MRQGRAPRIKRLLAPLLLYLLAAIAFMWPYYSVEFRPRGDLAFVIAATAEARYALAEGQFPIRVAPHQLGGVRHPIFQYYGNFPYTVTGWLCRRGLSPNTAWCALSIVALATGAFFTHRLAYRCSRNYAASVFAGFIFLAAPYQFIDLNARGAFTEFVAMNLLPAAMYLTHRAFVSPRWRYVGWCGITWTLIGLTHNIAYVYGILFSALMLVLWPGRLRRLAGRVWRLALAGLLTGLLIAWYFVPQLSTLNSLNIHDQIWNPYAWATLTPLYVLLSPFLTTTPASATAPGLGLQVGMPVLASALLATAALLVGVFRVPCPRWRGHVFFSGGAEHAHASVGMARAKCLPMVESRRRATLVALVLFAVALVGVWSPVDFWRFLPHVLWFVQFPYRLLMFVILWGAVAGACGLACFWPRGLPPLVALVALIFLGICVIPYVPRPVPLWPGFVRQAMQRPEFVRPVIDAYLLNYPTIHGTTWVPEEPFTGDWEVAVAGMEGHVAWPEAGRPLPLIIANKKKVRFRSPVRYTCSTDRPIVLELPVLYYPKMLEVRDNGRVVRYGNAASFLAVKLGPGEHRLAVRFIGIRWANVVSAIAWIAIIAIMVLGPAWHVTISARRRHV